MTTKMLYCISNKKERSFNLTRFFPTHTRRSLTTDIGITDPKVTAPVLLIMGEKDYCLKFPGFEDFIRSGAMKQFVPDLVITFVAEGSHFVHEQFPELINELITTFLDKHGI